MFAPLVRWALTAPTESIPAHVLGTAKLQHIAGLGVLRTFRPTPRGQSCLAGSLDVGGTAALLFTNHDDYLLAGRSGLGALPAAWANRGRTLAEVLADTVVANEVAGRVGFAFANAHHPDSVDTRVAAVASAVLRARQAEVAEAEAVRMVEAAVFGSTASSPGEVASVSGAQSVAHRIHTPPSSSGNVAPNYPSALGALGQVWLTETLVLKRWPGTPWANVALDALNTILERHLKAAEKRLRPDQLDRIEFIGPSQLLATESVGSEISDRAGVAWSLSKAAALLVGLHELSAAHLDFGAAGDKEPDILALEPRITVAHDWKLTTHQALSTSAAFGRVLGERGTLAFIKAGRGFTPGLPPIASWAAIVNQKPWNIYRFLREKGGLAELSVSSAPVFSFPIQVKLYTTRGGWWPERRDKPEGWGSGMLSVATQKHGDAAAVTTAVAADQNTNFGAWMDGLLA